MKYLKTFESMSVKINESYNEIEIGDLVFCKNEGHNGLVGLVVPDENTDELPDDGTISVYFRGLKGEILTIDTDDVTIINDDNLYLLDEKSDLEMYKRIALRKHFKINSYKYEEIEDEQEPPLDID